MSIPFEESKNSFADRLLNDIEQMKFFILEIKKTDSDTIIKYNISAIETYTKKIEEHLFQIERLVK